MFRWRHVARSNSRVKLYTSLQTLAFTVPHFRINSTRFSSLRKSAMASLRTPAYTMGVQGTSMDSRAYKRLYVPRQEISTGRNASTSKTLRPLADCFGNCTFSGKMIFVCMMMLLSTISNTTCEKSTVNIDADDIPKSTLLDLHELYGTSDYGMMRLLTKNEKLWYSIDECDRFAPKRCVPWTLYVNYNDTTTGNSYYVRRKLILDRALKYKILHHVFLWAAREWSPALVNDTLVQQSYRDRTTYYFVPQIGRLDVAVVPPTHIYCYPMDEDKVYAHANNQFLHLSAKWHWAVRYEELPVELANEVDGAVGPILRDIRDFRYDVSLSHVMLHEVGHVFGINHVHKHWRPPNTQEPSSVMEAFVSTTNHLTSHDKKVMRGVLEIADFWRHMLRKPLPLVRKRRAYLENVGSLRRYSRLASNAVKYWFLRLG